MTPPPAWHWLALLGVIAACAQHDSAARDTSERAARIMDHVHALARDIGPRAQGSDAARRAADHIAHELERLGLQVERQIVGEQLLPAVAVGPVEIFAEQRRHFGDANLVVRLGPPASAGDKAILFMAHYDSVYGAPGAVDNAASVAALLDVAHELAREAPPRPVIIAFTAAEEVRLAGARALFAELGDQVGLAVSLDLLGATGTLTFNGLSALMGQDWLRWLAGAADRAGVRVAAPIPHRVISRLWPQIERSDHGVFTQQGVPAFHLYSRPADALYLPYHTWLDTADRVDARVVTAAARLIESLSRTPGPLPRAGGDAGMWLPVPGRHWIAPAWAIMAMEGLLLLWIAIVVVRLIRGARSAGQDRPWRSAALDLATALGCHAMAWLIAHACLRLPSWLTGHPMPWVHQPVRHVILAVIMAAAAGTLLVAVLARLVARWRAPRGPWCYLALALACCALAGAVVLALGLHELAWIPLVHGALLAGTAHTTRPWSALVLLVLSLAPLLGPLHPNILREAVFNGFLTPGVPLALVLGVVLLPAALGAAYAIMRFSGRRSVDGQSAQTRLSRRVLARHAAALVVLIAAAIIVSATRPACDARSFTYWNLTCELTGLGQP